MTLPYNIDSWAIYAKNVRPPPNKVPTALSLIKKLKVPPETRELMIEEISAIGLQYHHFKGSQLDQDSALRLLGDLNLHIPNVANHDRDVRSKLAILNTDSNEIKPLDKTLNVVFTRHRRLYQCQSGSDHTEGPRTAKLRRHMPWENVGCGFWARMTTTHIPVIVNGVKEEVLITIDEICGDLVHSAACAEQTEMSRNPTIPIHPDLRRYTLQLVRDKLPLNVIREKARVFALERWGTQPGDEHYRFRLRDHDSSSLYRSLNKEIGIPVRSMAHDNLDAWFGPTKAAPDPLLVASCLYYQPEILEIDQRFMLILLTPVQRKMAWKYGHRKQVLMDLTFGFSNARTLLVILMVIDDDNKGIPIAQIIFTAKKDAKAVHADYNTEILTHCLREFISKIGKNEHGETFCPAVGSTDNDIRERHALNRNCPGIFLILCMFHILQSWRNHLNISLGSIPKGEHRNEIRSRLWKLLMKLIRDISDFSVATALYNTEVQYFKSLGKSPSSPMAKKQSKAALHFLNYLHGYLKLEDYWRSWSPAGAMEAARLLGIPVTSVARTTNHLESFNGRLKNRFFKAYEHTGRLPRLDLWVYVLVCHVLPDFFESWLDRRHQLAYYDSMRTVPSAKSLNTSANNTPLILGGAEKRSTSTTLADVEKDANAFMDRAFLGFTIRSNVYTRTFTEEHKMAVLEFEISMAELGESDGDSTDLIENSEVLFLGGKEIGNDISVLIPSQNCVEPSHTPPTATHPTDDTPEYEFTFPSEECVEPALSQARPLLLSPVQLPPLDDLDLNQLDSRFMKDGEGHDAGNMSMYSEDGAEFALDSSTILTNLDFHIAIDSEPGDLDNGHSNERVTAMMELQGAEDSWLQAIKSALRAGLSEEDIKEMLSPSIIRRLKLHRLFDAHDNLCDESFEITPSLASGSPDTPSTSSLSLRKSPNQTSLSPALELLRLEEIPNSREKITGFEHQKKERRHVSHRIR